MHKYFNSNREDEIQREIFVDFSDSRWIIDLDINNIITKLENKIWADSLRETWQGLRRRGDEEGREPERIKEASQNS